MCWVVFICTVIYLAIFWKYCNTFENKISLKTKLSMIKSWIGICWLPVFLCCPMPLADFDIERIIAAISVHNLLIEVSVMLAFFHLFTDLATSLFDLFVIREVDIILQVALIDSSWSWLSLVCCWPGWISVFPTLALYQYKIWNIYTFHPLPLSETSKMYFTGQNKLQVYNQLSTI